MRGTVGLGLGIAVVFAGGVLAVSVFGNHDGWFLRAARDNAVRCLTKSPCPRIDAGGVVVPNTPPPLTGSSACAKPGNWQKVETGQTTFVVTCRDGGRAYLYHLGKIGVPAAGQEQWMACAEAGCASEIADLK